MKLKRNTLISILGTDLGPFWAVLGPEHLDSSENGAGEAPASIAIDTGSSCAILSRFKTDFMFFLIFFLEIQPFFGPLRPGVPQHT